LDCAFFQQCSDSTVQLNTCRLTTNTRDPDQVLRLADVGLLDSFGVSAGKGEWQRLVAHPRAVINLLLWRGNLPQVMA
jgi:hypothetical protein